LRNGDEQFVAPRTFERRFSPPLLREGGEFSRPFTSSGERRFAPQYAPSRTFDIPMNRGEDGFTRSFSGGRQGTGGKVPDGGFCFRRRC
jgi:hypothetical protein